MRQLAAHRKHLPRPVRRPHTPENTVPNIRRILDGLESGSQFTPFIMTKILMMCAGGYDQGVIIDRAIIKDQSSSVRIDIDGFREENPNITLTLQYGAQRRSYVRGRQSPCCYLI